jgi:hypothetical protein
MLADRVPLAIRWPLRGVVIAIAIGALGDNGQPELAMTKTMQPTVLHDGFAVLEAPAWQPIVREIDRSGAVRFHEYMPVGTPVHSRVVGTSGGTALAWLEGWRAKLALIDADGELTSHTEWGTEVNRLCDQVASTDLRYGIGWQEPHALWLLHGSVQRGTHDPTAIQVRRSSSTIDWCGITSADDQIALLWFEDGQTFISMCSTNCSAPRRVQINTDRVLLGFGCVRDGCAIAYVDHDTYAKLGWFTASGELVWTMQMGGTGFRNVSIANAGCTVVASYGAPDATVFSVTRDGITRVWHDPDRPFAPAVVWSNGVLMLSHLSPDLNDITFDVMPLPCAEAQEADSSSPSVKNRISALE